MPNSTRWIGLYGNGALAALAVVMGLAGLIDGPFWLAMGSLAVVAVAVFNIRLVRWVIGLNAEEEWLQAEVRKAELRQHLAALGEFAHEPEAGPNAGPPTGRNPPA